MDNTNRTTPSYTPNTNKNYMNSNPLLLSTPRTPRTDAVNSEGFQFSFSDTSKEERKNSCDPSPSPMQEISSKSVPIVQELSTLQTQIHDINLKISQNLEILKGKEARNQELKQLLLRYEQKSTFPTEESFADSKCTCAQDCGLF